MHVNYSVSPGQLPDSPVFVFEMMDQGLERGIDTVTRLSIVDENGSLPLLISAGKQNSNTVREWRPARKISGNLQVSYYVPVADSFPKKRGPHIDLQSAGGGLSGTFGSFLLLPFIKQDYSIQLAWTLPRGHKAVSSFGDGDAYGKLCYEELMSSHFLAGPLVVYPGSNTGKGFIFYSLGKSLAETEKCIDWSIKAYELLRDSLQGDMDKPFRFLLRSYNGGPTMSGNATNGSFLLYMPLDRKTDSLDVFNLVAHEMVHVFVPGIEDSSGMHNWYSEGIADYLSVILPYKAGLYSTSEYLELINTEAALYYTNALRETPQSMVPEIMWQGTSNWSIPYARGMIYFAILDTRLRATGNNTSLLAMIRNMNDLAAKGSSVSVADWKKLLLQHAGNTGVEDFDRMLSGKLLFPSSNAFGPGFSSRKIRTGYFYLGFGNPNKIRKGSIISSLDKKSSAAKAGLRDGDLIAADQDLIPVYSSFHKQLRLEVERNKRLITVEYNPRKGVVDALEWVMN